MGTQNVHWELFNTGLLAIVIWDMASGQVQNYFIEKETKLSSFDFAASSWENRWSDVLINLKSYGSKSLRLDLFWVGVFKSWKYKWALTLPHIDTQHILIRNVFLIKSNQITVLNIARGTTDPGYWVFNLSYLSSLIECHLHCLQIWPTMYCN